MNTVSILGAGSFGTALAKTVAPQVERVFIYARDREICDAINEEHQNPRYFPSLKLDHNIKAATFDDSLPVAESDLIIFTVPSGVTREVVHDMRVSIGEKVILSTAKGIEQDTLMTMSQIIKEESGGRYVYSISGPTFADELIRGYLSSATLGVDNEKFQDIFSDLFGSRYFALDFSNDIHGVELAGVLKNIYAIALGIFDSVDSSHNGHYTFLSLCYKEMTRLLKNLTSDPDLTGKFCAFGDYNLTANVDKSRNRTLGLMIGKNFLNSANVNSGIVFEGLKSIKCILKLVRQNNLDVPIVEFVNNVLEDNSRVLSLVDDLLRQFGTERRLFQDI